MLTDTSGLTAGAGIEVRWAVANARTVQLVEIVTGGLERTVIDLPGPNGTIDVTLPADKREVNYRLRATEPSGEVVTSDLLFSRPLELPGWVCSDPDDVVTFADPFIETYVRSDIYGGLIGDSEDILCRHVQTEGDPDYFTPVLNPDRQEQHHALIVNRCDQGPDPDPLVESLEGVQHLIYLRRLELECNELHNDDLKRLAGLTSLRHVWLMLNCEVIETDSDGGLIHWENCLQDLSPLAGLSLLETLVVHMNEVSSLEFLNSSMSRLQLLHASANRIRDLTPLEELPALQTARLDGNLIAGLTPLAANTQFPASSRPFGLSRGTVNMPPPTGRFEEHLSLHYNCLDTNLPQVAADHSRIIANGARTAGIDIAQAEQAACQVTVAGTGAAPDRAYPEAYLRELSTNRHH